MVVLRRFLVLGALLFWQGGFLFYASVVVPVGSTVFGSHLVQAAVTQPVTNYLNLGGGIALLLLLWDVLATGPPRRLRSLCWAGMALTLAVLVYLHPLLDDLFDPMQGIADYDAFRPLHRLYLWVSTVQWSCGLGYLWLTLRGWRVEDGGLIEEGKKSSAVDPFGVAQSPK
jgi:hypothetical protein